MGLDPVSRVDRVGLTTDLALTPELPTGKFRLFPMILHIMPWKPVHLRLWNDQSFRGPDDSDYPYYAFNPISGLELLNFKIGGSQLRSRKFLQSQVSNLNVKGAFGFDLESYGYRAEINVGPSNTLASMTTDPTKIPPGWDPSSWLAKGPFKMNGYLNSLLTDSDQAGIDFEGKFYHQHTHVDDFTSEEFIAGTLNSYNFQPISTFYRTGSDASIGPSNLTECLDLMWHNYEWALRYRAQNDRGELVPEPVKIVSVEMKGLTLHYPDTYGTSDLVIGNLDIGQSYISKSMEFLDHELKFSMRGINEVGYIDYHDEDLRIERLHTGFNEIYFEVFLEVKAIISGVEAVGWVVTQLTDMAVTQFF